MIETAYDRIKQAIIRCDLELSHMLHDRNEDGYHEHHELVDALIAGDGARADRVMAAQVPGTRGFVLDALTSSPTSQSGNVTRPVPATAASRAPVRTEWRQPGDEASPRLVD